MAPLTIATFPLQSWRMLASLLDRRFQRRDLPVDLDGARLWATVEANAAARAVVAATAGRLHPVGAQFGRPLQALRRAGLHARPASFALLCADGDLPTCFSRHVHLAVAVCAMGGRCNHFVVSQYWYSSSRNLGWAISINDFARSRIDLPCRYATPYSVTTYRISPREVTTPAPGLSMGTILEIAPFLAVDEIAMMGLPPLERDAPRRKSTWPPMPL